MSTAREFFSSPDWDEAARAEFARRIRRVPSSHRARRFQDKAHALFYRGGDDPERRRAAIALLERALDEATQDATEQGEVLEGLGIYHLKLGERGAARDALRRMIAVSPVGTRGSMGVVFPEEILARILLDEGDEAGARALFDGIYRYREIEMTQGRWRLVPYPELAAREVLATDGTPLVDPEQAAEGIRVIYEFAEPPEPAVPGIANADRAALAALDAHYRIERFSLERRFAPRTAFHEDYLHGTHIPQLGAYLGRVLCRCAGGQWRARAPLLQSRVVVGEREVDPFHAAYDNVYYEIPLARAYDRLATT